MDYRGGFPQIPEIMMPVSSVCEDIMENLEKETDSEQQLLFTAPAWCAYAGMGAVAKWNENWSQLRDKGILESLTAERGYYAMDEYVMDCTGIGWGSEECKRIESAFHEFTCMILNEAFTEKGKFDMTYYFEALKAMYLYGMVLEMSRLGMH